MENIQSKESSNSKTIVRKISLEQINLCLSIVIKLVVVVILLAFFAAGRAVYQQYAHSGPNCSEHIPNFQYWLDNREKIKGKVVSVHQSRLQTENGTTQCFGQFKVENGEYRSWVGSISELANKEVIGQARFDQ